MGLWATFIYSQGRWSDAVRGEEYLAVDVHDSDIATVDYSARAARGRFYLGFQPRDYFEDPSASEPVDNEGEAVGLAEWAKEVLGVKVAPDEIRPLLAEEGEEDPDDTFVEDTVERLLKLLGLPLPQDLGEDAA